LPPGLAREEIAARLSAARPSCLAADLAFYAFRDLASTDPRPHVKAALERSPVCAAGAASLDLDDSATAALLSSWPSTSIYSPTRLAQPDEVWNSRRGDGLEKALTLASILHARHPKKELEIRTTPTTATLLSSGAPSFSFPFSSPLPPLTWPLTTMLAP
ncbi:MAG: hypothetical protein IK066_00840, partial [Kiritimatiellae bacterium]|nr:hypothetical protein [Kiritimatiellia bacterium]